MMIGKTILHYKILEKLGEGGMGVVYLAEDTKLKRNTAIKFLPHRFSINEEEKRRFEIEAQAAASLNHPNITTIYAIEKFNEEYFIAMEYVKGKELDSIIESSQTESIPFEKMLYQSLQIAEGLEAAHKKGIVHRDIKSQNIMITETDKIKIMDFGLAKIAGGMDVTQIGTTVGTISYMSPEQSRGVTVDHRTDIWSFGVVLYEIFTGELPFKGSYDQAIIYSILNEKPPLLNKIENKTIQNVITKALEKNVDERYLTMSDLISDLKSAAGGKATKPQPVNIKKLAVLPFCNILDDQETNFLGFALADQIIGALAYSKKILVRPSSAIRKFQNEVVDIQKTGSELIVDYILTGNYLKVADTIRLNMELIELEQNKMIWREPVELQYKNVFELQDIVSQKVVKELKVRFSDEERILMKHETPGNQAAYQIYLRALSYPPTIEGNKISVEMLRSAINLDPEFAPAYHEAGIRLHYMAQVGENTSEDLENAIENLNKAISLKENFLQALASLALIYTDIGKHEEAHSLLMRALKINPNDPWIHFSLSYHYRYIGFLDESEKELEIVFSIDPENPRFRSSIVTYMFKGKYDEVLESFDLAIESPYTLNYLGEIAFRSGRKELSKEYFEKVIKIKDEIGEYYFASSFLEFFKGNISEAIKFNIKREEAEPADGEILYEIARLYALFNSKENCIRALKKSIDMGFVSYPFMIKDSFFNAYSEDEDIQALFSIAESKHQELRKNLNTGMNVQ